MIEVNILGYLLTNPRFYFQNYQDLKADMFLEGKNREVFEAYLEVLKTHSKPNIYQVSKITGDYDYLSKLTSSINYSIPFPECLEGLKQSYLSYRLTLLTHQLNQGSVQEKLKTLEDTLLEIQGENVIETTHVSEGVDSLVAKIKDTRDHSGLSGTGTGIFEYDRFTGGFHKSDLVVIAGETSQGKTSFALTMLRGSALRFGAKVCVFSYEMTSPQILSRLLAQQTGLNAKAIMTSQVSDEELEAVSADIRILKESSIYIDPCKNTSIDYISNSLRGYKMRYNVDLAVIDYLQLIRSDIKGLNREQEVGTNTRRLKNLAKELDMTIMVLSQLNRDKGSPKPTLNRLRDSGQIEEAADQVLFIYRPEMYGIETFEETDISTAGVANIILAKGRNVGTCSFFVRFDKFTTNFTDFKNESEFRSFNERSDDKSPF